MSPTAFALGIGFDMVGLGGNPVVGRVVPGGSWAPLGGISSFTRADPTTCRSYRDVNGVLQVVAANVLRDAHYAGPIGATGRTVLLESAATNLCLRSDALDNAAWANVGTPTTTTGQADNAGGTTAVLITDADASIDGRRQTFAVANDNTVYTASIEIPKTAAPTFFPNVNLRLTGGTTVDHYVSVNAQTGALAGSLAGAFGLEDWGTWWRLWVAVANNSSGNTSLLLSVYPAGNTILSVGLSGPAQGARVFWRAQVEARAFPTSPIATAASAVSGAADALVLAGVSGTGPATLFYRYWDLATQGYLTAGAAYTYGASITPPVDRAYTDLAILRGTLTAAQCAAALGY